MRLDAIDAELGVENKTPRTIEGPLYVAGAPVEQGFARLDDGSDTDGHPLVMHGTVYDADGKPAPCAQVGVGHCDNRGRSTHFDTTANHDPLPTHPTHQPPKTPS